MKIGKFKVTLDKDYTAVCLHGNVYITYIFKQGNLSSQIPQACIEHFLHYELTFIESTRLLSDNVAKTKFVFYINDNDDCVLIDKRAVLKIEDALTNEILWKKI